MVVQKNKTDQNEGEEEEKDNCKKLHLEDEVQFITEYKVQSDWIMKILKSTFRKLKLMSHMPILLNNNGEILKCYLPDLEVNFLLTLFSKYGVVEPPKNCVDLRRITDPLDNIFKFHNEGIDLKTVYRGYLSHAIDIIFNSKFLCNILKCMPCETDPSYDKLLHTFFDLMQFTELRLKADLGVNLKDIFMLNQALEKNIEEFEDLLYKQKNEVSKLYDFYDKKTSKYNEKFEKAKQNYMKYRESIVFENEKNMVLLTEKSDRICAELKREAEAVTATYDALLEGHANKEKKMKAKYIKNFQKVENWIAKYDKDVTAKQYQFDALEAEYNKIFDKLSKLKADMVVQEREWKKQMTEKREYEERELAKKLWHFKSHRSARIIQRAWRAYWKKIKKYRRRK